jgi:DNA-binding transcriptional LysR family regulator
MEIRHLRYFVAVAEEQNVTRAAARLHVTQPCLSRQIRDLENEFAFTLFERRARAIRLTEAGRVFLLYESTQARTLGRNADNAILGGGTKTGEPAVRKRVFPWPCFHHNHDSAGVFNR